MMSRQAKLFRCESCGASFDSTESLDKHIAKMREPQPTLPAL
jgi:hypothetical protein